MDEVDIMCELAVMYAVACGVANLLETRNESSREVNSLEANAVACGTCFLRDGIERLWAGMRELV